MKRKTRFAALLLAAMLLLGLLMSVQASESSDAADTLNALGLFQGTGNGYELDREPTRAEALVMLIRLLGKEAEAKAYAADCPLRDVAGRWMAPYVGWAYANGITKGVSDTAFDPDSAASGKMYATFVLRALGYSEEAGDFTYSEAVSAAAELGLASADGYKGDFLRGDAVLMSCLALSAPCKGGDQVLLAKLVEEGAVSSEAAEKTGLLPPVWPEGAVTVTVACVGDSLTYGMGTDDPVKQSYPTQLGRITGPYRFVTERYGHSGATVEYDNFLSYAKTAEYADSLNTEAELVLLMLGTNDTIFAQNRENFPRDFEKMVQTYLDLPQHPRVIILLPPHFFSDGPMYADSSKNLEEIIKIEKAVAEEMGLATIDVYGFTEGRFDLSPDGVHFTAEGYQLLAEFLYENLSALLEGKEPTPVTPKEEIAETEPEIEELPFDGPTYTVACVGDSLTEGLMSEDPATQSYPSVMAGLTDGGIRFITENYGLSGACVDPDDSYFFALPYNGTEQYAASVQTEAEIVLVMLGTNDAFWSPNRDIFEQNFTDLLQVYISLPQAPQVVAVLPPHVFFEMNGLDYNDNLAELLEKEKAVAQELGLPVIDAYSFNEGQSDMFVDGIHFTVEGYALLAETIYTQLCDILAD